MKYLLFILSSLLLFSFTGVEKNDLEKQGLKGKVKRIIVYEYHKDKNSKNLIKDTLPESVNTFSSLGYLLESIDYQRGKISYRLINKYDAKNNLIEKSEIEPYMPPDNPFNMRFDSLLTKIYYYTNKFNKYGKATKVMITIGDSAYSRIKSKYNSSGQCIEEKTYKPIDTLKEIVTFTYDKSGNVIERTGKHADKTILFTLSYTYDSAGNTITAKGYYNNKLNSVYPYDYIYKYDSWGNKIREVIDSTIGNSNNVSHEEYSNFDSTGNWLTQKYYDRGQLIEIEDRTIEYY